MDDFRDGAGYVVFDDIPWGHIPNRKGFFGGQGSITITGKYRAPRTIQWGRPCILLCNGDLDPLGEMPHGGDEYEWFMANVVYIKINEPLFA